MAISQARIIESLEQACSNLNPDEFIYSFLDAYGFPKSTITRLRKGGDNRNVGEGDDIGLKKKLYFRAMPAGTDLDAELDMLKANDVIARNDIRFVIVTDFNDLVAFDTKAEERLETSLSMLDKQYAFFLPLAGYEKAIMYSEHPADVKASEKMGQLFDLIRERNDLSKPEDIHALNVFLTRLLFCFYAEDTGIFEAGQMTSAIQSTTQDDGTDVDQFFTDLFTVLNLEQDDPKRKAMPAHLQAFPYVNGGLFRDDEPIPEFGRKARRILLDCGLLNWSEINPDIFGSMFQAVIDEEQRGNLGQHYTSVSNIMKVIQPLFLDKLYAELEKSRKSENKLKALLVRLQNLRIFDPACGSGNFLIIAYKELRKLEMEVIDALNAASGQAEMYYSGIRLAQFYGIEIDDFAHEVAVLSLWLAEHQMNMAFKAKFGYAEAALPLRDSGNIVCGNALRSDWEEVCLSVETNGTSCEVYICGNPPFLGGKKLSKDQIDDMILSGLKGKQQLDYVACWFFKASKFIRNNKVGSFAFVATSSICQGEQVHIMWPDLLGTDSEIFFAYAPFNWSNNAKRSAGVVVTIIGIRQNGSDEKVLYSEGLRKSVKSISPYLIEGNIQGVVSRSTPLSALPSICMGSNPVDGKRLIIEDNKIASDLLADSVAQKYIKRYMGGDDFLREKKRYCIWVEDEDFEFARTNPFIKKRIEQCYEYRKTGGRDAKKAADFPHRFCYRTHQNKQALIVPKTTSAARDYIPIGLTNSDTVINVDAFAIYGASLFTFGILSSSMHKLWADVTSGKLGSGMRYSAKLTYNTFPLPEFDDLSRRMIEQHSENILFLREDYPDKTIADLYDPADMPEPLREAHKALDRAVELLYRERPFRDESERLEHLFACYEQLIAEEQDKITAKKKTTRSK
ncbi:TPA: class I SAM-dependent DNA methyltransferase [Escherichia coli]|nr:MULTISPECIES: DNA methyltransferase [Enterobacteriaceae]EGP1991791.1 class I SAM-dependent DNA methyltransferase [Salmonella enterica subsp. enterica serovar Monschaui]AYP01550.1 class I SAM-dependent DNA methyltransferase [Escherichia coli]EFH8798464.1 class I SAM-dependent DNA methyltransferase [Escherichia coli]EIH4617054.1 class I SAM-dependent DNA methyltransferase [Escherichia coli]EIX8796681.1 class I SAM-dependent DNA methyltransferase [Escherichia coli]